MSKAIRVLCLDQEGGHGGSSRSLYSLLSHMSGEDVAPEVWCRRGGTIESMYGALRIPCQVHAGLPAQSSQPRSVDNLVEYARFLRRFRNVSPLRQHLLATLEQRFDALHLNHEGFWWLARWLRPRTNVAMTAHVRTRPVATPFAKAQMRTLARVTDGIVFITENERDHFADLCGGVAPAHGTVIYNTVPDPDPATALHPGVPQDERLKVALVSNYSWARGNDRAIDVAALLAGQGRRDILFVVAGDAHVTGLAQGPLGPIASAGGTLEDYVRQRGLADMFLFLGHVPRPEGVVLACDLVARLSRENSPWGRDVIEALALGRPVLATGTWPGFVRPDQDGWLIGEFDPASCAALLLRAAGDRTRLRAMGESGRRHIASVCGGLARAADLTHVWQHAVHRAAAPGRASRRAA